MKLEQLLTTNGYTKDDLTIISNPTSDHVAMLISSASLMSEVDHSARKSLSSQISIEKRVEEVPESESEETEQVLDPIEEKPATEEPEIVGKAEENSNLTVEKSET